MIAIVFCEDGEKITFLHVKEWAKRVKDMIKDNPVLPDVEFKVATTVPIEELRTEVHRGTISNDDIIIKFNGERYYINKQGWIPYFPLRYKELPVGLLEDIFGEL